MQPEEEERGSDPSDSACEGASDIQSRPSSEFLIGPGRGAEMGLWRRWSTNLISCEGFSLPPHSQANVMQQAKTNFHTHNIW